MHWCCRFPFPLSFLLVVLSLCNMQTTQKSDFVPGFFPSSVRVREMNVSVPYTDSTGKVTNVDLFLMGSNTDPAFIATLASPQVRRGVRVHVRCARLNTRVPLSYFLSFCTCAFALTSCLLLLLYRRRLPVRTCITMVRWRCPRAYSSATSSTDTAKREEAARW